MVSENMKRLTIYLLFSCAALAQPTTTRIVDTIYDQSVNRYNGSLTVSLNTPSGSSGGSPVINVVVSQDVIDGAIDISIVPNDRITPANSKYVFTFFTGAKKTCTIPTSATPITLAPYCVDTPAPAPLSQITASQIVPGVAGTQICSDGSVASWGTCGGGGGSTPCLQIISFTPTPTFDFSVCTQVVMTLSGNAAPVVAHPEKCEIGGGCTVTYIQGSAYTVTWAGNVLGGFQIGKTTGKRNTQSFTSFDGLNLSAITPGVINQ
jgi:hypothetical protein